MAGRVAPERRRSGAFKKRATQGERSARGMKVTDGQPPSTAAIVIFFTEWIELKVVLPCLRKSRGLLLLPVGLTRRHVSRLLKRKAVSNVYACHYGT